MQIPVATPDTVAANKIKEATNVVTAHVDSLATQLHPDSIAAMTPWTSSSIWTWAAW